MTVRFGVIGTGFIADRFAEGLQHATGAKMHSVLSRKKGRAEVFAARHGSSRQYCYEDLDVFLKDRYLDAVYIATPTGTHADLADAAAAVRKHVFVEKPMATTVADARRIIEACRQAGVHLGVGYQNRCHPCHVELRGRLQVGWFGDVLSARARWFYRVPAPPDWRLRRDTARWWALGDVGTHAVDLLRFLFGEVESVTASFRPARLPGAQTEDTAALFLRFGTGLGAFVECSSSAAFPASVVEIVGTRGAAVSTGTLGVDGKGSLRVAQVGGIEADWGDWPKEADLYVGEIEAFLRAIRGQGEPLAGAEDGLRNVEVLEAASRSAAEGRLVPLSEVSGG